MPAQRQIQVLVVDDSVVMRRIVARTLERDPSIARTDFAVDGAAALVSIGQRRPDVVVLDLEMPVLDGFATLQEIRRTDLRLPVVLFSSLDERVATATLAALSLGATDFVVKPRGTSITEAETYVAQQVTPLVLALAASRAPQVTVPAPAPPTVCSYPPALVDAVVLGTSTGGPDALSTLVQALPTDLPVPMLVVQHMPPMFTRLLAERLHRLGRLPVREAQHGDLVQAGTMYVAPGDRHLELTRVAGEVRVVLGEGPPENSCRPAADVLFRSAVQVYGGRTLAVVMTGMGQDGLAGCRTVRAAGGQVLVQDPATALIASMPESVVAAGLAQAALPLGLLGRDVGRRAGGSTR